MFYSWNLINVSWFRSDPVNSFIFIKAWGFLAHFYHSRRSGGDCSALQPWEGEDCGGRTFLPLGDCPSYLNHFGTSGSLFGEEDTPHMYCGNSFVATSSLKTSTLYLFIHDYTCRFISGISWKWLNNFFWLVISYSLKHIHRDKVEGRICTQIGGIEVILVHGKPWYSKKHPALVTCFILCEHLT